MNRLLPPAIALTLLGPVLAQGPADTMVSKLLDQAISTSRERIAANNDIWEDHSTWETAWQIETEHYSVKRLGSYAECKAVADVLEKTISLFESTLGIQMPQQADKLKVFVLPDAGTYRQFGEDHGQEHSSFFGSFYASGHPEKPVAVVRDRNWGRQYLVHSALHQFLDRTFPGGERPLWIEEGLAAYFQTACWGNFNWARSQFYSWREDDDKFVPLQKLMSDPIASYTTDNAMLRMVEFGMMFSYLLHFRDDTRTRDEDYGPFRDYLVKRMRGQDVSDDDMHEIVAGEYLGDLENELRTEQIGR